MSASKQTISAWKFTPPDNSWNGHTRVQWVVSHLASNPIEDTVLEGHELDFTFTAEDTGIAVQFLSEKQEQKRLAIHYHAFKQICQKVGFPPFYGSSLLRENADWAEDLVAANLRELYSKRAGDKAFLLRSVNGQLRGFLTNAYKRLNTEKLIEVFAASCSKHGAKPYDGVYTPIRIGIQAATDDSFKVAGRNLRVGVMLRNSDFGAGALEIKFFLSPAIGIAIVGGQGVRRIHKGHRLSRNMEDNQQLEACDLASATKSIQELVEVHLDHENTVAAMAEVQLAAQLEVNPDEISNILKNLHLSKDEFDQTKQAFLESNDPRIPAGNTMFRLASTIAWLGSTCGDPEKQLDLQELAGSLILKGR
jgi:hypothetical protein